MTSEYHPADIDGEAASSGADGTRGAYRLESPIRTVAFIEFPAGAAQWPMDEIKARFADSARLQSLNALDWSSAARSMSGAARRHVDSLGPDERPDLIVAYCTGVALALEVSKLLGGVVVAALDPAIPTEAEVLAEANELLQRVGAGLVPALGSPGSPGFMSHTTELLKQTLANEYPELSTIDIDELVELQTSWLAYLVHARATSAATVDWALTSLDAEEPPLRLLREDRFAVRRAELPAHPEVQRAFGLLADSGNPRPATGSRPS
ncbi:hypothetical protein [Nocardioides bruguierae]|uniref:Uncharacterized protein n=1 Tax=Nocardioides bruguierae TaxID=2945102 RepID=A0A9X2DBH3_9ACTN|nr:hypothetical protein [Nocardioides bruguierae]MCM0622625.1 hypothetical protein [Nocardioides bruguierae]